MYQKTLRVVALVALAMVMLLPATANAMLVNEYGLYFAGQSECVRCHTTYGNDVHGSFARDGLGAPAPSGWTVFHAAGDIAPYLDPTKVDLPGGKNPWWTKGGTYPVTGTIASNQWTSLGAVGYIDTEILLWKGSTSPLVNPWNLIEGLRYGADGEWIVGEDTAVGLYDATYNCQRCHMLGTTRPKSGTNTPPNPNKTIEPTTGTGYTWARDEAKTLNDFLTDPEVSKKGMGIDCEQCHGTGMKSSGSTTQHQDSGTELSHRMSSAQNGGTATDFRQLLNSQVCGQCHGSYTDVAGTAGVYGYTPNLQLRNFVNINGNQAASAGSVSYTKVPTEEEFALHPKWYQFFPNGSNARGNHFYYNDWSTTAHAARGAYYSATEPDKSTDPDQLVGAAKSTYDADTWQLACGKCHAGEYYLKTKGDPLLAAFTPGTTNIGYLGVECVTCHESHPLAPGDEGNIREPDQAGERSNAGRTTDNESICEDCHNWQYEIMGTAPVVAPLSDLGNDGGPKFPQRETLHGRSMIEVPEAEQFMPDVACEECHMTWSNRGATRISHGMKINTPADMDRWAQLALSVDGQVYIGEDSCSPCHPANTRDELQADIDGWQGDCDAAAAGAATAISAAQTRSEFSMTNASSPGYILVGKATWNYKAYKNDLSGGVHNPPYVMAGLEKAQQLAKSVGGSFQHVFCSSSLSAGNMGFVTGKIINGDGTGAAGATVQLIGGSGGTTTTDANGNFSFMVAPSTTTTYQVKWVRSSDTRTDLLSPSQTISVSGGSGSPAGSVPVYRFYNLRTGSHFYTASEDEKSNVVATMAATLRYEGVAYTLNTASPDMTVPLYRFYNMRTGAHFYTAGETEKNNVIATMSATLKFEGVAYYVSGNSAGTPVYRFYNLRNGTHFYTAGDTEKNNVMTNYPTVYRYEGPAFYLAP